MISATGTLADINPIRYRGYYYDQETGLYHLWSRYYDPQTGRFISADKYTSTGQGMLGYNMFAYCRNNPISRKDALGTDDISVTDVNDDDNPLNDVGTYYRPGGATATGGNGGSTTSGGVPGKTVSSGAQTNGINKAINFSGEVTVKYGNEVKLPNQINANNAVDAWNDFLGPNQTSYNQFTGANESNRIFSADGTRSIRFGSHEMRSIGTTKAHFHYEYWRFDPASNVVYVENLLQRLR